MLKNMFDALTSAGACACQALATISATRNLTRPDNTGRDGWDDILGKQHNLFLTFRRYTCRFLRLSAKKETDTQPEEPFYYQTCEA